MDSFWVGSIISELFIAIDPASWERTISFVPKEACRLGSFRAKIKKLDREGPVLSISRFFWLSEKQFREEVVKNWQRDLLQSIRRHHNTWDRVERQNASWGYGKRVRPFSPESGWSLCWQQSKNSSTINCCLSPFSAINLRFPKTLTGSPNIKKRLVLNPCAALATSGLTVTDDNCILSIS